MFHDRAASLARSAQFPAPCDVSSPHGFPARKQVAESKCFDLTGRRVWVVGQSGMIGQGLVRRLGMAGCHVLSGGGVDPRRRADLEAWMAEARPQAVFLSAAIVNGAQDNARRPGEFLYDNMAIISNVIEVARRVGVEKLMFFGFSRAYPHLAVRPASEGADWGASPEADGDAFAAAKLAGITQCKAYRRQYGCDFISVIPASLYGPGEALDAACGHLLPATIRRIWEAKARGGVVEVWGTGSPLREFLHVDDAADAMVYLMEHYSDEEAIHIGAVETISIRELVETVASLLGFTGEIRYDTSKPDGMPRRPLDGSRLHAMGWWPKSSLREGLAETCRWMERYLAGNSPAEGRQT